MRNIEPARSARLRFRRSEKSSGEPRRAPQMPGGANFAPGRGSWALIVLVVASGCLRCWSGEIWGRAVGASPLSCSARSLGVRPWVGCSVTCWMISRGMHARILVCAYIRFHSSASLSQDPGSLLRLGGHHDFAPFRLLSASSPRPLNVVSEVAEAKTPLPSHPFAQSRRCL